MNWVELTNGEGIKPGAEKREVKIVKLGQTGKRHPFRQD
jgi:hypothetical protein